MKSYGVFAKYYDTLISDVDYSARMNYIGEIFKKHEFAGKSVLDLACGTGSMSFELAKSGYDVIGVDASAQMLSQAVAKATAKAGANCQNPIFICQDMCSLDLYGTVSATVCTLDGINHLTSPQSVKKAFASVSLFLERGGLFVFDLNTPYKIANTLSNNTFVYDYGDIYCVWQNSYNEKNKSCRFDLTFFESDGDCYFRSDESFSERAYTTAQIKRFLDGAGLSLEAVYDDLGFNGPQENSERLIYVARKI
jgi:ubiquinone/menaquinone biosynthesis C-methylase UbiE